MSGLLSDELFEELSTELAWLKSAVVDLSERLQVNTYTTCILKHSVEPEEIQALERIIFLNALHIDTWPLECVKGQVAQRFFEITGKEWGLQDDVLQELLDLKLRELDLR